MADGQKDVHFFLRHTADERSTMRRKLEELNLLDDFLFGTMISQMNYYGKDTDQHGARLDVYLEEDGYALPEDNEVGYIFDFEPDNTNSKSNRESLPRRVRFYRSTIDVKSLQSGKDYSQLKNVMIIMLMPYDPFGYNRIAYTVKNRCLEEPEMNYEDGAINLFLYTKGTIGEIPQKIKELLHYLENTTPDNAVNEDLKEIQTMVENIKQDKEVSISYMKAYERDWMMRNEGKAEAMRAFITNMIRRGMTDKEICILAECDEYYVQEVKAHLLP